MSLVLFQSCFPANTYAIHIINHSWIFDKIFSIFKPFLDSVMRSKIYFHGSDFTSLHKHIIPDYLPVRYGGIWPDYSYTIWFESLRKNIHVAKEMINCGYKFREEEINPEVVRQLKEEGIQLSWKWDTFEVNHISFVTRINTSTFLNTFTQLSHVTFNIFTFLHMTLSFTITILSTLIYFRFVIV